MTMKLRTLFFALLGLSAAAGLAFSQTSPGYQKITSLSSSFLVPVINTGPQNAMIPLNGGTLTCTAGGTITVANTNVDAGSLILLGLKTAGGTVAAPFVATTTAGTGFTVTCGASDTSVYIYAVLG